LNFFFDRCVSIRIARMLAAFDRLHQVTHQDDDARFDNDTPDVELIRLIAEDDPKPVLITADVTQRKDPIERKALRESQLTVVFLRRGFHQLTFHQQAVKLLTIWPEVVKHVERVREPTAFEISPAARKLDRLGATKDL
jgi:hypothetical protein